VAQVEIVAENEVKGGWEFSVQVLSDTGDLRRHRVTLSWADYNLWSADGADQPEKVIEAVMGFLLSRTAAEMLGERFDASMARRKYAEADVEIPKLISR